MATAGRREGARMSGASHEPAAAARSGRGTDSAAARTMKRLFTEPQRFEFFQAVRLLEMETARQAAARREPLPPALGGSDQGTGSQTAIRFHSATTLGFPQGAITRIHHEPAEASTPHAGAATVAEAGRVHVDLGCFGLVGPAGTLPRHYTSLVIERFRRFRDQTLRDFLDIFVHRMAAMLYGGWVKYRAGVQYERSRLTGRGTRWDDAASSPCDPVTAVVSSLVGLGTKGLRERLVEPDDAVFHHASHFSRQTRTAEALESLLRDLYGARVEVVPFVGRWLELERSDQTALASRERPEGLNARLGVDAIAGRRVWDLDSTFEVRIGPLSLADLRSRLPGTPRLAALNDLLRLYAGPQYEIVVRLVLAGEDVPPCRLLKGGGGPRLGWTSWLSATAGSRFDRDDARFRVRI
jgi:type VI secretion system protein ImpH